MENKRDRIDELIDAGLERYAGVEPPLGMESRVLARVREQRTQPVWWKRGVWLGLAAAAAVLAIVAGLELAHRPALTRGPEGPEKSSLTPVERPPAPTHSPAKIAARPPAHPRRPQAVALATGKSAPRQEQFPSPAPPSAQERLLAHMVRPPVLTELARTTPGEIEFSPVEVKPVEIKPLPDLAPEDETARGDRQ